MDDALYGERNKRGIWKPLNPIVYPPAFVWPAQPVNFLKWLFGYPGFILPWNMVYVALSIVLWLYLTPSMETMKSSGVIGLHLANSKHRYCYRILQCLSFATLRSEGAGWQLQVQP